MYNRRSALRSRSSSDSLVEAASATPMLIVDRIRCPSRLIGETSHTRRMRSATTTALSSGVSGRQRLFAAQPAEGILGAFLFHCHQGQTLQSQVAGVMPVRIVDLLEMVCVEDHDGEWVW
ncbi:MAG: hypothetical protein MZV64_00220 [Ignavibacteriales bacterium]|nr:hypothetical protein [Ignavibacteriales bacterium]